MVGGIVGDAFSAPVPPSHSPHFLHAILFAQASDHFSHDRVETWAEAAASHHRRRHLWERGREGERRK